MVPRLSDKETCFLLPWQLVQWMTSGCVRACARERVLLLYNDETKRKQEKWTRKVRNKTDGTRLFPHSENTFQKHSEWRKVLRVLNSYKWITPHLWELEYQKLNIILYFWIIRWFIRWFLHSYLLKNFFCNMIYNRVRWFSHLLFLKLEWLNCEWLLEWLSFYWPLDWQELTGNNWNLMGHRWEWWEVNGT